jgi:hypothetical protein
MPGFTPTIDLIINGQNVDAPNTNKPLSELQGNVLYLYNLLQAIGSGQATYVRSAPLNPAVLVGQPVYYNTGSNYYDLAQAGSTAAQNVVGLVASKAQPNVGDIVTGGYISLSLTNALNGAGLAAGRYYLSSTLAGVIVATQPTPAVQVCLSDGLGNVFVVPQVSNGPPQLQSASGNTADAYAQILALTGANGIVGNLVLKNTGGSNTLGWQLTVTDAFGDNNVIGTGTLAPGVNVIWDANALLVTATLPPYTSIAVSVKSQSPGNPTSYVLKGSVVK